MLFNLDYKFRLMYLSLWSPGPELTIKMRQGILVQNGTDSDTNCKVKVSFIVL